MQTSKSRLIAIVLAGAEMHPIYGILRLIVLGVILYATASEFDETEIITLLLFASGEGGVELLERKRR